MLPPNLPGTSFLPGVSMRLAEPRHAAPVLAITIVLAGLVFAVWPGLDLWVSSVFYRPATGFWLAQLPWLEAFRNLMWDLTIMAFVVAVVGVGLGLAGRPLLRVPLRDWSYISALYLLGPVLLVNLSLKAHWGRARPADVIEFGGTRFFTPPWQPTDQCISNCSFVSGEVSATVVMGIAMLVVGPALARYLPKFILRLWVGAAYVLPLAVAVQRVITGRHFLSDAVFAALFMLLLALMLKPILGGSARVRD